MHHALTILDILEIIIFHVSLQNDRSVLALALTCRAFFLPAMSQIWRNIHPWDELRLKSLLQLMPIESDITKDTTTKDTRALTRKVSMPAIGRLWGSAKQFGEAKLKQLVKRKRSLNVLSFEDPWARFLFHAGLIRTLYIRISTELEVANKYCPEHRRALRSLVTRNLPSGLPVRPSEAPVLFSRLRTLTYEVSSPEDLSIIMHLLSERLEDLTISLYDYHEWLANHTWKSWTDSLEKILSLIPACAPNLHGLSFLSRRPVVMNSPSDGRACSPFSAIVVGASLRLYELRSLACSSPVDIESLRELSRHATLKRLKVELSMPISTIPPPILDRHDSGLQELLMDGHQPSMVRFFTSNYYPTLSSVTLSLPEMCTDNIMWLMTSLGECRGLRVVRLRQYSELGKDVFSWSMFRQLMKLHHMVTFICIMKRPWSGVLEIDSADLLAMGKAWPQLRTLVLDWEDLDTRPTSRPYRKVDLVGIACLIALCPDIRRIKVNVINATTVPPPLRLTDRANVLELCFLRGSIFSQDAVAEFLIGLNPNIRMPWAGPEKQWQYLQDWLEEKHRTRSVAEVIAHDHAKSFEEWFAELGRNLL